MKNLAKMLNAAQFFSSEQASTSARNGFVHLDYMNFAERYADYVVDHEKFIDRTGLASVEKLENAAKGGESNED